MSSELKALFEELKQATKQMQDNADYMHEQADINRGRFEDVDSLVKEQDERLQKRIDDIEAEIKTQMADLARKRQAAPESSYAYLPDEERRYRMAVDNYDDPKAEYRRALLSFWRKGQLAMEDFNRLASLQERAFGPEQVRAMSVDSQPNGGYFVLPEFSDRIVARVFESSPVRQVATVETISSDSLQIPIDNDEPTTNWEGETSTTANTATPTLDLTTIPVHTQRAAPRVTQKLLDDAAIDIEAWLAGKVARKFARTENTAFVTGDGVAQPRGFTTYASGTTWGQIQQQASGNASALTADGIIDLVFLLKAVYRQGAVFGMNKATMGAVRKLKGSDNNYLWVSGLAAGIPNELMGYPVFEMEDLADVAASALPIAFGNFAAGYTIVDRIGIQVLRDPFSAKPHVEFYTRKRVGGAVVDFDAIKLQVVSA